LGGREEKISIMTEAKLRTSILFVCMGNICRSPTAEGVFLKTLEDRAPDLDVEVDSAGTHSYHVGHAPDRRAQDAARARGVDLSSLRARLVIEEDFSRFDLVLAMDDDNVAELHEICPVEYRSRVRLLMDFAPTETQRFVPDPYYGGGNGFEKVLDLVESAARGLIDELRREA
jgi:protein-tyrosine phosphatase